MGMAERVSSVLASVEKRQAMAHAIPTDTRGGLFRTALQFVACPTLAVGEPPVSADFASTQTE